MIEIRPHEPPRVRRRRARTWARRPVDDRPLTFDDLRAMIDRSLAKLIRAEHLAAAERLLREVEDEYDGER